MRIRKKEIRRTNKRQEERWKAAHKGTAVTAAGIAAASGRTSTAPAGRAGAGSRSSTSAPRPARRTNPTEG